MSLQITLYLNTLFTHLKDSELQRMSSFAATIAKTLPDCPPGSLHRFLCNTMVL